MAGIIVRDARANDADDLVALRLEIVRDPLITFTTVEPGRTQMLRDIANASPKAPLIVAEKDGHILGAASWKQFRAGPGYRFTIEHSIHLFSASRGLGAGRVLMETLLKRAADEGFCIMVAGISGGNELGYSFHRHFGFTEVGRMPNVGFKNNEWYDLILMQRSIR